MIRLLIVVTGALCGVIAFWLPASALAWTVLGPGLLFVVLGLFCNLIVADVLIALYRRRENLALVAGVFAKPLLEIHRFLHLAGPEKIGGDRFETLIRKYYEKEQDKTFIERSAIPEIATECRRLYESERGRLPSLTAKLETQSTKFSASLGTKDAVAFDILIERLRDFCALMDDSASADIDVVEAYLDLFIAAQVASKTVKLHAFTKRQVMKQLKRGAD